MAWHKITLSQHENNAVGCVNGTGLFSDTPLPLVRCLVATWRHCVSEQASGLVWLSSAACRTQTYACKTPYSRSSGATTNQNIKEQQKESSQKKSRGKHSATIRKHMCSIFLGHFSAGSFLVRDLETTI